MAQFRNLLTLRSNTIRYGDQAYDWEYILWTIDTKIIPCPVFAGFSKA